MFWHLVRLILETLRYFDFSKFITNPLTDSLHVCFADARILELLNTGSLKDLQTLQRVGAKRASLIHSWRQLNGSFTSFNDLKDIIGLTPKYIDTLLKANLVHLETGLNCG